MAPTDLKSLIQARTAAANARAAWTPADFLDLGNRDAIDKALQRLDKIGRPAAHRSRSLRPPRLSTSLTQQPNPPDPRGVIDAVARRDQIRVLVDGMTAANDLGLTDAVPAKILVHTDARLRPIRLGNLEITFRPTAASKLYWAGRPAMRVVQALHWLRDLMASPDDEAQLRRRLYRLLADPVHGAALRADLADGLPTLPAWMQRLLKSLLLRRSFFQRGKSCACGSFGQGRRMMNPAYDEVLRADADTRLGLFTATAQRLGTTPQNVEKDFWVCWTLDALFNGLPAGGPRLLFKGGTSLSKGFGLISRFSEDIDVTVFRDDLGKAASIEEMAALSRTKQRARLDAMSEIC